MNSNIKYRKNLFDIQRIIFWEPCTSPHKADFFSALVDIAPEIEVICCAQSELPEDRKAQGWSIEENSKFKTIILPTADEIHALVIEKLDSTLHIFSGLRRVLTIVAAIKAVKKLDAKFAIWHEPRVGEGWKGKLRFVQSWICEGWFRRHAEFILAIGRNGPVWFNSVGYPNERIFPFAYFVSSLHEEESFDLPIKFGNEIIQIGYVGRLVKEKGVFDIISTAKILDNSAHIHFVGTGIAKSALQNACENLKITASFHGVIPIEEVSKFMGRLDVLVLASVTKDGWGVVVSEALMAGTAVVATNCVGASILLNNEIFGRCVPANSPDAIANAIIELKLSGAFSDEQRKMRAVYARQCLNANAGARHLLEIMKWRFGGVERPIPFYEKR